jgi:2-succinyl-5-enolpyruvyl-6-hydroxy-3-cyclohexene-1-carboxylate synthase
VGDGIPELSRQAWQAAVASSEAFGEAQLAQRIRRYLPEQGQLFVGNSLVVRLIDAWRSCRPVPGLQQPRRQRH